MVTIAIIGGTGQMGRWLGKFFRRHKCKVELIGRRTKITLEKAVPKADIVVISVPLDATTSVIKKVAPLVKKESLIMDITSLKKEPMKAMLDHSQSEVLGTHPMFGPTVKTFLNQAIILCPGRGEKWRDWIIHHLLKEGAKIKVSPPDEHDKMMSVVQAVTHFTSLTLSHVWKDLGIDVKESEEYSSPVYKLNMDMVGRILSQDPKLYAHIGILNPYSEKALDAYLKACQELSHIIKKKDVDGFVEYFNEGSKHFGDFKKEAYEYSNYILNTLSRRKKKRGEIIDGT
jgi:prephenate dehydrogenase